MITQNIPNFSLLFLSKGIQYKSISYFKWKGGKFPMWPFRKVITDNIELFEELKRLNPKVNFKWKDANFKTVIISVKLRELNLPKTFYYNHKNGITNNRTSGSTKFATLEFIEILK